MQHPLDLVGDGLRPSSPAPGVERPPHPVRLDDPDHRPDLVQHIGCRIIDVLLLGDGEKPPVSVECLLHGLHRTRPPAEIGTATPG